MGACVEHAGKVLAERASANLLASLELAPTFPVTYRVLASCYAHTGRLNEAREIVRRQRAITPLVMEPATSFRGATSRSQGLGQSRSLCLHQGGWFGTSR
jgi:pentatricopeptide repeat protein